MKARDVWGFMVALLVAGGVFRWFAVERPYQMMRAQIAALPLGIAMQTALTRVDRGPEVACSSVRECRAKLRFHYNRYTPDPTQNIKGPTLIYRMAGMGTIHCLYFSTQQKLVAKTERTLPVEP